eukprot:gene4526-8986_t
MTPTKVSHSDEHSSEKNGILVAVRIRPLSQKERNLSHSCCDVLSNQIVSIRKDGLPGRYLKSEQGRFAADQLNFTAELMVSILLFFSYNEYCFDTVFDENTSQNEVYVKTTEAYIPSLLNGYNLTVFAYGATGGGKTHTMMGNFRYDMATGNGDAGIIPNALVDVFQHITQRRLTQQQQGQHQNNDNEWMVTVSYLEVYNEQIHDLLEHSGRSLLIREDQEKGKILVVGLTESIVESAEEVLDLLHLGNQNRKTESTMANSVSSRSHAVLQLTLKHSQRNYTGRECITETKLSLIDLAGSERASATNNRGTRLQEGASINKSLLALANCINSLSENSLISSSSTSLSSTLNKRNNVKYRDSKLTHLLKCSLEGKCQVIMIANINPSHHTFEDSHNTLKYANRAKNIKVNNTMVNEMIREGTSKEREIFLFEENSKLKLRVIQLEEEVIHLRHQLLKSPSSYSSHIQSLHVRSGGRSLLPVPVSVPVSMSVSMSVSGAQHRTSSSHSYEPRSNGSSSGNSSSSGSHHSHQPQQQQPPQRSSMSLSRTSTVLQTRRSSEHSSSAMMSFHTSSSSTHTRTPTPIIEPDSERPQTDSERLSLGRQAIISSQEKRRSKEFSDKIPKSRDSLSSMSRENVPDQQQQREREKSPLVRHALENGAKHIRALRERLQKPIGRRSMSMSTTTSPQQTTNK